MFFPAADTIAFATSGTEDFRIGSAGELGVQGANYGTSGQVLTSGGSGAAPSWSTPAGGGNIQSQLFTASGSWTAPTGVTKVRLTVIGGGGGASADGCTGYYGGYGGYGYGVYTVTPGTAYTVTIGAGGAGANSQPASGSAGATSSFGALLSATGGGGGTVSADGASGSASSANLRNTSVGILGYPAPWGGPSTNPSGNVLQPAQTWSISSPKAPGAAGGPFSTGLKGHGGYSGIVFVEWVG
jgi:hypothetical protein